MKNLRSLLLFSIAASFVISCGRKQHEAPKTENNSTFPITELAPADVSNAENGDWLVKTELSDAEKLNPIVTNDATASGIYLYIFENLLEIDRVTYELKPLIAKAMPVISDDHLTYTFELKENVTFSDGKPLTGEDIIFTIKAIKNPFTDAQALRNYFVDVSSVELVDGNKFKVQFKMSKPYFRAIYSIGDVEIIPKHILDKDNVTDKFSWSDLEEAQKTFDPKKYPEMQKFADFLNSEEVSRSPKYVIGSGPYVLDKWITGQSLTLKKNENYWNKSEIPNYPNKIIFKTIADQNAAIVAAKNKEIDHMEVYQPTDFVENVKNPEQFNLRKALVIEPAYNYIAWNNEHPIFSDKKVRWALS